jgi:hypothetical protein
MKIDEQASKALQEPDTHALAKEMTPERRARFSRVCGLVDDLLRAHVDGPLEAYMILKFMMNAFEETYGIRGAIVIEEEAKSSS